ncbi:sex peptide receptor-related protein 2-like [Paramacrobiotus metropolitanus]|uniref:sex peptide receptor-related protein 2-like n=1 Tax=Paramacrobiotus metropolitanus TaxID=2943436 RepID=UPI002446433C|nr:sex peptide receptor-related protein 2-like [Paramacrobiotus metropolitanus]
MHNLVFYSFSACKFFYIICFVVLHINFNLWTSKAVLISLSNEFRMESFLCVLHRSCIKFPSLHCVIRWIHLPEYIFVVNPDIFNSNYIFDYVNDYVQGLYIWLQSGFPRFADWVLVVFSVERFRAVVKPLSQPISIRVSRINVVTCFLYGTVACVDKAIAQYYLLATLDIPSFDAETSLAFQPSLPQSLQTWNAISIFYGVVETFVIFGILLICNVTIIYKVINHRRKTVRLQADSHLRKPGTTKAPHRAKQKMEAPLLISAVSVYLICRLPQAVNDTLGRLSRYPFCFVNYQSYNVVWRPADVIMLIPYSINFYLYCAFSTKFRKGVKATFTVVLLKTKLWKNASSRGQEESTQIRQATSTSGPYTLPS